MEASASSQGIAVMFRHVARVLPRRVPFVASRSLFIKTATTPNPECLKFYSLDLTFLEEGKVLGHTTVFVLSRNPTPSGVPTCLHSNQPILVGGVSFSRAEFREAQKARFLA